MAEERVTRSGKQARPGRGRERRRGRSTVAALLTGFLIVAFAVIWRRSYGIAQARRIAELDRTATQLEAERARLDGLIRDASSRGALGAAVQKLGMHVPDDRQVRIIHR